MAVGTFISSSGFVTLASEERMDVVSTDVERLWTSGSPAMSTSLQSALSKGPVAASFSCADAASYLGTVDLLGKRMRLSRTLLPTWASTLALVADDLDHESLALAVHVDGNLAEICLSDCGDGVVEVVDLARLEVGEDERSFATKLGDRVGKMLFACFQGVYPSSGNTRIDVLLSAPNGPSDALAHAVRSVLPPSGVVVTERRMDATDLARGAMAMAKVLDGTLGSVLLLTATWWSASLVCSGRRHLMIAGKTTVPTLLSERFGTGEETAMPSAVVIKGISGVAIEFPLPSTGISHAEITLSIYADHAMSISYRDLDRDAAGDTLTLKFEDLLRAHVRFAAPRALRPKPSPWELSQPSSVGASGFSAVSGAGVAPRFQPQGDDLTRDMPSEGAVALRNALVRALDSTGAELLKNPHQLRSYVMDLIEEETPELRVLLIHADEELLAPVAAAAATGEMSAIKSARAKVYLILAEDRLIVDNVARNVAWALTAATACAVGGGLS